MERVDPQTVSGVTFDPARELDWEVIKSLMDAQAQTRRTMEQYLLYLTHDEMELNGAELETCLDQAIQNHERAIEDLELARELVTQAQSA